MDWSSISSTIGAAFAVLLFLQSSPVGELLPREFYAWLSRNLRRFYSLFTNYIYFKIDEYDGFNPNDLYAAAQLHLSDAAASAARSARLSLPKNAAAATCTVADNERVLDTFEGTKIWWEFSSVERSKPAFSWNDLPDEKRSLKMCIQKKDRDKILKSYVPYLRRRLHHLRLQRRERFLFTNLKNKDDSPWHSKVWTSVPFKHPSNFSTLALHPSLKNTIKEDLQQFASGREFYDRVGRAWKRGYLLYGPPGTGKSSMIAAMANFLEYDIYDLELTQVKSNSQLRSLLVKTTNRSIIVIEDIDCSLDLTNERQKKKKSKDGGEDSPPKPPHGEEGESEKSKVTLSGLLNFVDGLWSCCGDERIFVFTTNHVDKLDKALLRPGRMDMHIELSYCCYEAFKILARNYLELEEHPLFEQVQMAFNEEGAQITPAEVSEVLTRERKDVVKALTCLIKEIKESKFKRQEEREEEERKRKEREKELQEEEEEEREREMKKKKKKDKTKKSKKNKEDKIDSNEEGEKKREKKKYQEEKVDSTNKVKDEDHDENKDGNEEASNENKTLKENKVTNNKSLENGESGKVKSSVNNGYLQENGVDKDIKKKEENEEVIHL